MRQVLRRILGGVLAVAVGAIVVVAIMTNHSSVTTPSMYPTIPPGSMIFVSKQHHYHVGDVIEFRANGLVWAHRLIGVKRDGALVTKGDNPASSDDIFIPAPTRADVIGKVVAAPRWLGFPQLIVSHPAYGLSWLRYELGLVGRLGVLAVVALMSSGLLRRRRTAAQAAQAPSGPRNARRGLHRRRGVPGAAPA